MGAFLLGAAITAAYWPGTSGAATAPRWIIAGLGCALALFCAERARRGGITAAHLLGALLLAWSAATFVWSEQPADTIGAAFILVVLAACFGAGELIRDMRPLYLGAAAGLAVSDLIGFAQFAGWQGPLQVNVPAGLFVNRNYFAEASALVLVGLVAEALAPQRRLWPDWRLWIGAAACLPGLAFTGCRGALLAVLVLAVPLWRRQRLLCIVFLWVIANLIAIAMLGAGAAVKVASAVDRYDIWRSTLVLIDWTGHGLGSFRLSAPHIATIPYKTGHAYNEFLEAAFETGLVGLALLAGFCATLLVGPLSSARLVFVALMVEACFDYPFHLPATALLGALVAGHAARDLRGILGAPGARGMAFRGGLSDLTHRVARARGVRRCRAALEGVRRVVSVGLPFPRRGHGRGGDRAARPVGLFTA